MILFNVLSTKLSSAMKKRQVIWPQVFLPIVLLDGKVMVWLLYFFFLIPK